MKPSIRIDVAELRAQIARADVTYKEVAATAGIANTTVSAILRTHYAELKTLSKLTAGLNVALRRAGQPEISPFDLLIAEGFPNPQPEAPIYA